MNQPEDEMPRKGVTGAKCPVGEDSRECTNGRILQDTPMLPDKQVNTSLMTIRKDLATEDRSREKCLSKLMTDYIV